MSAAIRWGIMATGKIARSFARDLASVPDAELVAVGSRSEASARSFTDEHGGRPHGTYAALVADPEVEVVYIASPHSHHLEHARLALEAGKHVLCEKPLTLTVADAEAMFALAERHDRFLMEAMWTACHPVMLAVQEGLRSGRFGRPRHLHAELGFVVGDGASPRLLDPALGAGALLDMGIYPLTVAHLLLGEAESLTARADLSDAGIDLDVAIVGRYPGGALATMTASMTSWSSRAASISTDLGRLDLADFHHPTAATFTPYAGGTERPQRPRHPGADRGRRAGHRRGLRQRDRRGRAVPARRAAREPARPARPDPAPDAPDGRRPRPDRGQLRLSAAGSSGVRLSPRAAVG